jgi:phenylalanyl-tRNA synthetase alpha chain
MLQKDINFLAIKLEQELSNCNTINQVLKVREELSKSNLFEDIKTILRNTKDSADKKMLGNHLNELRKLLQTTTDLKVQEINNLKPSQVYTTFDPTFYSDSKYFKNGVIGNLHPITNVSHKLYRFFEKNGFEFFDSGQIESQWFNFTSVGTPDFHPARGMQDTFYLEDKDEYNESYLLRTQITANVCRFATKTKPPFKVIFPGIVFRAENPDATHDVNFHQLDMWLVDKQVTLSQLVTIIKDFLVDFFEQEDIEIRLRPSYFPFTQPSFEVDMYAKWLKGGKWVEIGGAGPIHKEVIKNFGEQYQGYSGLAFGMGLTRLAQLKLEITGLGQFYNGHLDFLRGVEF